MSWVKLVLQVIVAIPSILKMLGDLFAAIKSAKAQQKYESEKKKNEKITQKVEQSQSKQEAQRALEEAAKKWSRKN